jgi:hypothetical protein
LSMRLLIAGIANIPIIATTITVIINSSKVNPLQRANPYAAMISL